MARGETRRTSQYGQGIVGKYRSEEMLQRILHSRGFVAAVLAMGAGAFLYYTHPFPEDQLFLRVISIRAPHAFLSFKSLYNTVLFTTPYVAFSTLLSGIYRSEERGLAKEQRP